MLGGRFSGLNLRINSQMMTKLPLRLIGCDRIRELEAAVVVVVVVVTVVL